MVTQEPNINIPENVIEALEAVRASGETNMYDRRNVIEIAEEMKFDEAGEWLRDNRAMYIKALGEMGRRRE